ncbi:helix-turn-helix transcriptional regulator [Novosphingobium sp. TW-4]|uniref:Helix-turn-helix transcriptional regulator n=2 Tax=Novosphingobium olei TaxID=2728851 RepID=A0A7Y0BNJ2_9SPHN|nr:helix-turn-helix transcriptional regulator [Novosphingobium olei]
MPPIFADCKDMVKRHQVDELCSLREDLIADCLHNVGMADDKNGGPNFLRVWREYRKMTQEELGAACQPPTTGSVISLLEEGERGLSLKWLRRLAPALRTRPGWLADLDPREADTRTLEMIEAVPEESRDQVMKIIETFLLDGTHN